MRRSSQAPPRVELHPLTPDRWPDFVALFDTDAETRFCNCMWFRESNVVFKSNGAAKNRAAFKQVVRRAAAPPGILAYLDGRPAGWCALAPREEYPRLRRSPVLKPVDDQPAWSITCFFIAAHARGQGIARVLLEGAIDLAREHGARLLEGYPVDASAGPVTTGAAYHGLQAWFERAGFSEAARRRPARPIMRRRC